MYTAVQCEWVVEELPQRNEWGNTEMPPDITSLHPSYTALWHVMPATAICNSYLRSNCNSITLNRSWQQKRLSSWILAHVTFQVDGWNT